MARAVHYLHMKGISHRDIRPSNFLVDLRGRILLGDFGSAKSIGKSNSTLCYVGGRPYRAP
jgi:serine/threonine protein kinase